MRSFMVGSVVLAMAMTMAATGSAQDTAPAPSAVRPKIDLAPSLRVVGFHRAGMNSTYTGGALNVAVDVENTGALTADGVVVKLTSGGRSMQGQLSIPSHSTRTVVIQDADGLPASCAPQAFSIDLVGAGVTQSTRQATITSACKFTSTIENTWNQMTPDHVEAEKAGNVYISSASIVAQPACGVLAPRLKVHVVSRAAKSSPSLIIQEKEWNAPQKVRAQNPAAFSLAPNEEKDVVLENVSLLPWEETPATLRLGIVDWTKSLGGHTSNGGIIIHTTRACTLDFDLK